MAENLIFGAEVYEAVNNLENQSPEEMFVHVEDHDLQSRLIENARLHNGKFNPNADADLTDEYSSYMAQPHMKYRKIKDEDLRSRLIEAAENDGGRINFDMRPELRQEWCDQFTQNILEHMFANMEEESISSRMRAYHENRRALGEELSFDYPEDLRKDMRDYEYKKKLSSLPKCTQKATYTAKLIALESQCKKLNLHPIQDVVEAYAIQPFDFNAIELTDMEKMYWENAHSFLVGSAHELTLHIEGSHTSFLLICGDFRFEMKSIHDDDGLRVKMGTFYYPEVDGEDEPQNLDEDIVIYQVKFEVLPKRQRFHVRYGNREELLEYNHTLEENTFQIWLGSDSTILKNESGFTYLQGFKLKGLNQFPTN